MGISTKHKIKRIHPNIDTNRGTSNGKNLKNEQVQRQREELMILNVGNTTNTTNHQHIQNDTMNTSNSNNTMKTIHINDECTQNTQSNGQLAPLLDAYEPFSGSGNN